jgi:hypothetical protein
MDEQNRPVLWNGVSSDGIIYPDYKIVLRVVNLLRCEERGNTSNSQRNLALPTDFSDQVIIYKLYELVYKNFYLTSLAKLLTILLSGTPFHTYVGSFFRQKQK